MIYTNVLQSVAQELDSYKIVWGVGGSYLLALYNLYSNPNDLDLWVRAEDMPIVKKIFDHQKK